MNDVPSRDTVPFRLFRVAKYLAIAFVLLKAARAFPVIGDTLVSGDNDDMMRLLSVRAWLDGQSWYDMTQYRILPPEGISLHWSRFVDLGIAAIIVPASRLVAMPVAEQLALVLWPSLLLIALILLVARGTLRILGPFAACIAMLTVLVWLPIGGQNFAPGRIDHHNVQILMMTIAAYAMIWPGDPVRRGIVAGCAAAFSLAVGLEMLALTVAAGLIMALRAAFDRDGANPLLAAFSLTLAVASAAFFAGQTAVADWLMPRCDALAPPVLAVTLIAAVACLLPIAARHWLASPLARIIAMLGLVALGLWAASPLILPCLKGPYGALPVEVQTMMFARISEAQPGLAFAADHPLSFNSIVTPALGAIFIAALFWLRRQAGSRAAERDAVWQMLLLAAIGLFGSLLQIRMITLAAPALPFLTGYAFKGLLGRWQARPGPASGVALVAGAIVTLLAPELNPVGLRMVALTRGVEAARGLEARSWDSGCRSAAALGPLDRLPRARILTTLNLGTPLILVTHHDGLAAPYHRSAAAMWDGYFPFQTVAGMTTALATTGADYVVLCRKADYGAEFAVARALLRGEPVAGLQAEPFDSPDLAVFAVRPKLEEPGP